MADKLALPWLYETVSAQLAAEGVPATSEFGWRIPAQQVYGNRIAWIPGDPTGALGTVAPVRNPGGAPRSLATVLEQFTVIINGQDPTDPENELKQYTIVRLIRDAWHRAVYYALAGAFSLKYEQWITTRLERRHGAALRVVGELQATVPDVPWSGEPGVIDYPPEGDPRLKGDLTVHELDVTETIQVTGGET